ncbi:MAG: N-acetylmuramoyl-L-alanine amidase, partial [Patescibacteria group bacterium]
AQFGRLKESDLPLALGRELARYLSADGHFQVFSTRDWATGRYWPEFEDYFSREADAIRSFRSNLRSRFASLVSAGAVAEKSVVDHNFARDEVAIRLYGINKWANERDIDLVIHLHFNDYPGRPRAKRGRYRGFSIYVPEQQLPNHFLSKGVAEAVQQKLALISPVSNFPLESAGVIEDQELIAVGANASRVGGSLLIEYGYIYEAQFTNPVWRDQLLDKFAWQTAVGIDDYFAAARPEIGR